MSDLPLKITIDVDNFTVGAQMDLEAAGESGSIRAICAWLVEYAGVTMEDLRELKATELVTLIEVLTKQLVDGSKPSKTNGAHSSSLSKRGGVPRRPGQAS